MKLRVLFACYCLIFSTRCHASNQKQSGWSFWPTTQKSNPSLSKNSIQDDWVFDEWAENDKLETTVQTSQYCNPHKNDNQQPVFYDNPMQHQANNIEKNREKDFQSLPTDLQEAIKKREHHPLKKALTNSKLKPEKDASTKNCATTTIPTVQSMNIERDATPSSTSFMQNRSTIITAFFIQHCCACLPQINQTDETSKKKINR